MNIAHGEGFGLPLFEAAREGLPVITIGWSGQVDFLTHEGEELFQKVDYTLNKVQPEAVWEGVIQAESQWAYSDQGSYKMTLRKTYKTWHKSKEKAEKLKSLLEVNFSEEKLFSLFVSNLLDNQTEVIEVLQEEVEVYE